MANDTLSKAWGKIIGNGEVTIGRAGYIPVKVGDDWQLYRNTFTIYEGVETKADPEKVEKLRLSASDLVYVFTPTVEALERLGIRVKRILTRPIKTQEDVAAWAESIFNTGPVGKSTDKAFNTDALLPTKKARIKRQKKVKGETPVPEEPVLPPQPEPVPQPSSKRLGRPRGDGLLQGSAEAQEADREKKRQYQRTRRQQTREAAAAVAPSATVTAITEAKPRRLIRRPQTA